MIWEGVGWAREDLEWEEEGVEMIQLHLSYMKFSKIKF